MITFALGILALSASPVDAPSNPRFGPDLPSFGDSTDSLDFHDFALELFVGLVEEATVIDAALPHLRLRTGLPRGFELRVDLPTVTWSVLRLGEVLGLGRGLRISMTDVGVKLGDVAAGPMHASFTLDIGIPTGTRRDNDEVQGELGANLSFALSPTVSLTAAGTVRWAEDSFQAGTAAGVELNFGNLGSYLQVVATRADLLEQETRLGGVGGLTWWASPRNQWYLALEVLPILNREPGFGLTKGTQTSTRLGTAIMF